MFQIFHPFLKTSAFTTKKGTKTLALTFFDENNATKIFIDKETASNLQTAINGFLADNKS